MIQKENKYDSNINNSIIISSVDSEITKQLNFEKDVSSIILFYIFLSTQCNLFYIYLYIVNVFKYLFILSEMKESYLYYYYIKVVPFSSDLLPRSLSLPICCCKIIINNGVTNTFSCL